MRLPRDSVRPSRDSMWTPRSSRTDLGKAVAPCQNFAPLSRESMSPARHSSAPPHGSISALRVSMSAPRASMLLPGFFNRLPRASMTGDRNSTPAPPRSMSAARFSSAKPRISMSRPRPSMLEGGNSISEPRDSMSPPACSMSESRQSMSISHCSSHLRSASQSAAKTHLSRQCQKLGGQEQRPPRLRPMGARAGEPRTRPRRLPPRGDFEKGMAVTAALRAGREPAILQRVRFLTFSSTSVADITRGLNRSMKFRNCNWAA